MTMRYNGRSRPAARGPPLSSARVLARSRTRDTRRPRLPLSVLLQPVLLQLFTFSYNRASKSCLQSLKSLCTYVPARCKPCRRIVPVVTCKVHPDRGVPTRTYVVKSLSNPQDQGGLRRIATMCGRDDDAAGHSHSENRSMRSMRRSD